MVRSCFSHIYCVYHPIFPPISFWILGKGRIKILLFLILAMMSGTEERRWLHLTSREAECQGPLVVRTPWSSGDPWGAGTPEVRQQPLLPEGPWSLLRAQRPWQTCKEELGGACGGGLCLPSTHRQDTVEEDAQLSPAELVCSHSIFTGNHEGMDF